MLEMQLKPENWPGVVTEALSIIKTKQMRSGNSLRLNITHKHPKSIDLKSLWLSQGRPTAFFDIANRIQDHMCLEVISICLIQYKL